MMTSLSNRSTVVGAALALSLMTSLTARAQTLWKVDASAPTTAPSTGYFKMGTAVSPKGLRLEINNQYLTLDGKPWFPIMGEFHFSRTPSAQWEAELRKMKAAGIDVVATYVFWNHHEEDEGRFHWKDQRDLRRFIKLSGAAGLTALVRIGPWAHGEARYGGLPDWIVNAMPTRSNDAQYLGHVERLYGEIGKQLKGQLWKDGGPVIGVQLENEYNAGGPGKGAEHISALKRLAQQAGLDVPLYTVTGWDRALYPQGEVAPVFGGYPDEPWSRSTTELKPKETYAFRFDTRVSGDLGAQTVGRGKGTADLEIDKTPFLGAEYGPGLPFMYRRRPLVSADDIAAMLPVQLGSGVNLMGYYMFHGGRNPEGKTFLQESSLSGGINDTPWINYDFQAPLGPDGQQRPVLARLRTFHHFIHDFGAVLAPMTVRKPEMVPANPSDLATPRFSVRSKGDQGFVFVSNYVRQYAMAQHKDIQFSVALPGETLVFPSKPVTIDDGDFFIWPFNLDLDGAMLRYATAQPVARIDNGKDGMLFVFAAGDKIGPEFAFDPALAPYLTAAGASAHVINGKLIVAGLQPGPDEAIRIVRAGTRPVSIMVLSAQQARDLNIVQIAGKRRLVLSEHQVFQKNGELHLRSEGKHLFRFGVFPALAKTPTASSTLTAKGAAGLFQTFEATLAQRTISATVTPIRPAQSAPEIMIGGQARAALEPKPEVFSRTAAAWRVAIPAGQLEGLDDALLNLDFVGDVGRLFSGTRMLDDWYYSGYGWQYGLRQIGALLNKPLTISVSPLRADAPIYLDKQFRPDFGSTTQIAQLRKVSVTPVYLLKVQP